MKIVWGGRWGKLPPLKVVRSDDQFLERRRRRIGSWKEKLKK